MSSSAGAGSKGLGKLALVGQDEESIELVAYYFRRCLQAAFNNVQQLADCSRTNASEEYGAQTGMY